MSIKDLFTEKPTKILSSKSLRDLEVEVESERNIFETGRDKERFVPNVDFAMPSSFAKYGSAEEYYRKSIERIHDEYPYDGTFAEKKKFLNESTYLDLYVLDEKYPKTTGHAIIHPSNITFASYNNGYGVSSTPQYISIVGGPHIYPVTDTTVTDITSDNSLASAFGDSALERYNSDFKRQSAHVNVYDTDIYDSEGVLASGSCRKPSRAGTRKSNLLFDLENSGVTLEFWLKKSGYSNAVNDQSKREVIFDLWNQEGIEEDTYGRLTLVLTASEDGADPFRLTCRSGSHNDGSTGGFTFTPVGPSTLTTGNVADGEWHHYAVSVQNSGTYIAGNTANNSAGIIVKFYVDGDLVNNIVTGSMIGDVTGSLKAHIGTLQAAASGSSADGGGGTANGGQLTASLDDFRYWKSARTSEDVGRNWWTHVGGGTNTDIANTELGVYYKFNEGIVGSSSYDSIVLDYSGRLSNGTWSGYPGIEARSTSSAMVDSGYVTSEPKDPIIYPAHEEVKAVKEELIASGSEYDLDNESKFINLLPSFMIEEDEDPGVGEGHLKNLTNTIASYMDTLHTQVEALPRIQDATYISSSYKPAPFMNRVLEGKGFVAPELFPNAEIINQILSRDEDRNFDLKIHNLKNLIYKNIYNNLVYIYKSKGTEKSFRNLIRSFGVGDELVKINLYGDNVTHLLRDNFRSTAISKNYVDFADPTLFTGSVYQAPAEYDPYAGGPASDASDAFVSGSDNASGSLSATTECEAIFPNLPKTTDTAEGHFYVPFLSASLFGWHTPSEANVNNWAAAGADYGVEVYAVRPDTQSKDAYFLIRSRAGYAGGESSAIDGTEITSSLFKDVYENKKWNFSVSFKHSKNDGGHDYVSGSNESTGSIDMIFYGVNMIQDVIADEFYLTASDVSHLYLSENRRYYIGAHRENWTGTVQEKSFARISSLRHWQSELGTGSVRAHARDPLNYGAKNPYTRNGQFSTVHMGGLTASVHVPEIETLALHWDFHRVTGSDDSGQFFVDDASSGSVALKNENRYSDSMNSAMNNIISTRYMGKGIGFPGGTSTNIKKEYIAAARQVLPESLASDDMVSVLDFDDETFTRETRPIDYFFSFEKSMYQTISEEMLKMFATIVEFNNLIGEPVHKYRNEYKAMKKLRNLFFEKIGNTPNLDRYVSYYKWIDDALSEMLRELVPASANTSDGLRNMVESHVLERSKYRHKFPTLEMKAPQDQNLQENPQDPQGGRIFEAIPTSVATELIPWEHAHAPITKSLTSKKAWWRLRAERDQNHFSDGWLIENTNPSEVEQNKEDIRKTYVRRRSLIPGFNVRKTSNIASATYKSQFHNIQDNAAAYRLTAHADGATVEQTKHRDSTFNLRTLRGGSNTAASKKNDIVFSSIKFGSTTDTLTFNNISEDSKALRLREEDFTAEKIRKNLDVKGEATKGDFYSPFSLFKTSVSKGYNETLTSNLGVAADIANYHDDVVGPTYEIPLQGPFTEKHVGGRPHRHAEINRHDTSKQGTNNIDGKKDRIEAWKLDTSATGEIKLVYQDVHKPRGTFTREEHAKRPVNIRNIRTSDESGVNTSLRLARAGNYTHDYEILSVTNRSAAKRAFVKQEGFEEDSYTSTTLGEFLYIAKPDFSISGAAGRTEFAFVQRFSAPGGPETAGDARGGPGVDYHNSEYSPYNSLNYRNLTVRLPLRTMLSASSTNHGLKAGTAASSADYSGVASFHRTHPNNSYRVKPTSTGITDPDTETITVSDNFYISRAIPQSDIQYSWITASAVTYDNIGVSSDSANNTKMPLGYLPADGLITGLGTPASALLVVSASDAGSYISSGDRVWPADKSNDSAFDNTQFMYTDFVGLNYNVVEPINSSSLELGNAAASSLTTYLNGLGNPTQGNFIKTNNSTPQVLNALLLHRNGPYGWPSWKQTRAGQHPINRLLRRNSKIAVNSAPGKKRIVDEKDKNTRTFFDRLGATKVYREPVITSRHFPVVQVVAVRTEIGDEETGKTKTVLRPVPIKSSYGNNKTVFANPDLNDSHGHEINSPQPYDRIKDLYLGSAVNREAGSIDGLVELRYKETVYPSEQNAYLDRTRRRISFTNNFWRTNRTDRNTGRKSFSQSLTSSAWSLDATENFVDTITGSTAGILLNNTSQIHNGSKSGLVVAPYYSRLHMCESTASVRSVTGPRAITGSFVEDPDHLLHNESMGNIGIGGGHALWEASSQAGYIDENGSFVSDARNPAHDSYDDYVLELRARNMDMSVVPEFRISEHIDYYMNTHDGNFLAKNPKFLTIFGIPSGSDESPANSSEADFFKIYSNSDFMKHFDTIKKDHETIVEPSEIKLSCKTVMRFLPYDGFYPAERTVDLGTQFSKSVGPHIQYNGSDADAYPNAKFRNILTPYFAPGITYNTIKSGIACDYPIYNMGSSAFSKKIVNPDGVSSNAKTKYYLLGTSSYGTNGYIRIPFEDVVRPSFLKGLKILDNEPHPSSSLDVTASWGGESDKLYEMMSNNYHAAVPDFFLSDGQFTTLTSVPESQFESFETSSYYGMRVKVRKSYHKPRPINNRSKFPMPQDLPSDNEDYDVYESFTMYSRPSAFGPPVAGRRDIDTSVDSSHIDYTEIFDSLTGINPAFTPPYYDGECWFDIVFQAYKEKHTLREIFQTASVFSLRFDPDGMPTGSAARPYGEANINTFSMQLTSSFNLFGIAPLRSVEYDATGMPRTVKDDFSSDNNVWVMQPKFETPMLNFNDQGVHAITSSAGTLTLPSDVSASAMTPLGMWHQFGTIPDSPEKGVFFEVDDIEEEWLRSRLDDGDDFVDDIFPGVAENVYNSGKVKSLLEKVKFNKRSQRLGELASSKTVREAVVAVPFVVREGKRRFFEIPKEQIALALGDADQLPADASSVPGKSIVSMVNKMKRYVFPPPMDFVTYPDEIKPFAMYIFEFEHTFDQNDLSYMWQNLMPKAGVQIKEAEASISHKLLINELMGAQSSVNGQAVQSKLQWMVFKVKQRAPTNYFDKVIGNSKIADKRFDFAFDVENRSEIPEFSYNWPYDFFSLVEFAKMDAEIKFSKDEDELSVQDESQILQNNVRSEKLAAPKEIVKKG